MNGVPRIPGTPCGARLKRPRDDGRLRCMKLVIGGGPCRSHGGAMPVHVRARERQLVQLRAVAEALAANPMGPPPTPVEALLQELDRTHRTIAGLELRVATAEETGVGDPSPLSDRLIAERGHYFRVAADCVRLGVTPAHQSLAQAQGAELVRLLEVIFKRMGFNPHDPEIVEVVRSSMREMAAGLLEPVRHAEVVPAFADPVVIPGRLALGGGS